MFRLVPDPRSTRDVNNMEHFFNTLGLRIGGRDRDEIADAVRDGFADNFRLQRSARGSWGALKPKTIRQREELGFPGARPILFRTGSYFDTFTAGGHAEHFSQSWNSSRLFVLEEGSEDERVDALEGGADNMVARPVTDLTPQSERKIGDTIDDMLRRLMRAEGL